MTADGRRLYRDCHQRKPSHGRDRNERRRSESKPRLLPALVCVCVCDTAVTCQAHVCHDPRMHTYTDERVASAQVEREKGNECARAGKWPEAKSLYDKVQRVAWLCTHAYLSCPNTFVHQPTGYGAVVCRREVLGGCYGGKGQAPHRHSQGDEASLVTTQPWTQPLTCAVPCAQVPLYLNRSLANYKLTDYPACEWDATKVL